MTRLARTGLIFATLMGAATRAEAQGGSVASAAPTSSPAPSPPVRTVVLPAPPDSAVALCVDGTWVRLPGRSTDCGTHGGLKVAMPTRGVPPAPTASPAFRAVAPVAPLRAELQPPPGAIARCKDGTYVTGTLPADPCSANGGLAARLVPAAPAPRRP
ncbi:MAG TPA: hypothetical protein VG916_03600 [Gemmatimonadaceae bacterium]|nr:hypothetical protein [Gemmatimonadaceae bacterium]